MFPLPPATRNLLLINVAMFGLQLLGHDGSLEHFFALAPFAADDFEPWQVVTYSFLHGSLTHLLFNMLALAMFGGEVERVWGPKRYLTYYFACVISAALAQLLVNALTGSAEATIGASGGVFGLLLAFGMLFPQRTIVPLFPPIPMPAWVFVTLYGVLELFLGVTGNEAGVAHFAHLGGMLGGYLLILYGRARRRGVRWRARPRRARLGVGLVCARIGRMRGRSAAAATGPHARLEALALLRRHLFEAFGHACAPVPVAAESAPQAAEQDPAQQQQSYRLYEADRMGAEQVRRQPVPQAHHRQPDGGRGGQGQRGDLQYPGSTMASHDAFPPEKSNSR
jgi:membrane associated rhomboid family serine protease